MTLFLFVFLPLLCLAAGKLLGLAVSASLFYSDAGKRIGDAVARWCMPILPIAFVLLMVAGVRGNAGYGFTLFGSQELFELFCVIPFYVAPVLAVYAGAIYVIRDLTRPTVR